MMPFLSATEPASPRLTDAEEFAAWKALRSAPVLAPEVPATEGELPEVSVVQPTLPDSLLG
jgi:hypothetical protein